MDKLVLNVADVAYPDIQASGTSDGSRPYGGRISVIELAKILPINNRIRMDNVSQQFITSYQEALPLYSIFNDLRSPVLKPAVFYLTQSLKVNRHSSTLCQPRGLSL